METYALKYFTQIKINQAIARSAETEIFYKKYVYVQNISFKKKVQEKSFSKIIF